MLFMAGVGLGDSTAHAKHVHYLRDCSQEYVKISSNLEAMQEEPHLRASYPMKVSYEAN
jgi:hypothetical protein